MPACCRPSTRSSASVSGYTGGGRPMIEAYEAGQAAPFELYALGLGHKHIPEIMACTGLTRRPVFVPAVANFAQGMLVAAAAPHLDLCRSSPKLADLQAALESTTRAVTGSTCCW